MSWAIVTTATLTLAVSAITSPHDRRLGFMPFCFPALLADRLASARAARDIGAGDASRVMYAWDWVAILVPCVGAGLVWRIPDLFHDQLLFSRILLTLYPCIGVVNAFRRRRKARRLERFGGVERVFE